MIGDFNYQGDRDNTLHALLQVNGINTLGENIADNGAMMTGFEAFLKHEEENGPGQRLPGLTKYNSKQLFFLNLAQVWGEILWLIE